VVNFLAIIILRQHAEDTGREGSSCSEERKQKAKLAKTKVKYMNIANEIRKENDKKPRYSEEQIKRVEAGKKSRPKKSAKPKKNYSPFVMQKIAEREAEKKEAEA